MKTRLEPPTEQSTPQWVLDLPADNSPWGITARRVFWDRSVKIEDWRAGVKAGHRSYLPQTIEHMDAKDFIRFYGRASFEQDWPSIAAKITDKQIRYKSLLLDLKWSVCVGGHLNLIPHPKFWDLSPRCREFILYAANHPGVTTYAATKTLDMPYRRAHDYLKTSLELGLFFTTEETLNGRKQRRIWPANRWPAINYAEASST